jgi:N-formylglutamate deformylase
MSSERLTIPGVLTVEPPTTALVPLVLDSPHSGTDYPADFPYACPLAELRTAEDAFVHDLFGAGPGLGATLVHAHFPRALIDPNRAETDIDPDLLAEPWPEPLAPGEKSRLGLGLIRRLALPDLPVFSRKLTVAEVRAWIERFYRPYHAAVVDALARHRRPDGFVLLINCHSMKATGNAMNTDTGKTRPDFVISDRDGTTAAPQWTRLIVDHLRDAGHSVAVNDPYKGAEIVRRHGAPAEGRHAIQIEINRRLYLDQETITPTAGYAALKADLTRLLAAVVARLPR